MMGVFDLEKLARLVASRMGSLLVEHQRCSRIRSPLSKCSACVDICPVDALTFGEAGIELGDDCLACGLCAGSCPTGALELQEPTQLALLHKMQTAQEHGTATVIGCQREKELNPHGFSVPCLGSLSWELILAMDTMAAPVYTVLDKGRCRQCPVTGGGEHFLSRLKMTREIAPDLGLSVGAVTAVSKAPPVKAAKRHQDVDPDRRAFFRSVFAGAKQVPRAVLQSVLQEEKPAAIGVQAAPGVDTGRLTVLKKTLLSQKATKKSLSLLSRPTLVAPCHFCRVCAILCPVGALQCTGDYQLLLDGGKCVGCNLCIDLCLHRSLGPVPSTIADLYRAEPILIAQGSKRRCRSCGQETITSDDREECIICEKKAGWHVI